MVKNKFPIYLVSVLLFMLILPIISILVENLRYNTHFDWQLIGRWFVFWAVGFRLFFAGIKQAGNPGFTAKEIFNMNGTDGFVIIRELGFANIAIGLTGILSLFKTEWCQMSAIAGGLFFGLAGLQHLLKKPESKNELIALVSDLFICVILSLYVGFTLV